MSIVAGWVWQGNALNAAFTHFSSVHGNVSDPPAAVAVPAAVDDVDGPCLVSEASE